MTRTGVVVAFLCGAGALAGAARADLIVPVSQVRTVSVYAQLSAPSNVDQASDSAPDFGPFDSTVSVQVGDASVGSVYASASQRSSIGPDSVVANGEIAGIAPVSGSGFSYGHASSRFELTFDVVQPVTFTLEGEVRLEFPGLICCGTSGVSLFGGPGNQTIVGASTRDGWYPVSGAGSLLPGRYTLFAASDLQAEEGASISGSYWITFTLVPEPSTVWLVAAGLLVLGASRRSRARA